MTDPANPSENGSNPPAAIARHPGHELPFVQPSTYLHLRAPNRTASSHSHTIPQPAEKPPMTPLDRDQMQGLVSLLTSDRDIHPTLLLPWHHPDQLKGPVMLSFTRC